MFHDLTLVQNWTKHPLEVPMSDSFISWIRDEDSDSRAWLKVLSVDLVFKCVMNACTCFDRLFACVSRLSLVWLQFGRGPSVESSLRTPRNISSGPCPKKNDLDCSLFQTRT